MSSDSDDEDYFQMKESDPQAPVTVESILTNMFMSLFGDYGSASYWDDRYAHSTEQYEWFMSWDYLYPHISAYVSGGRALNIGAGDSPMSRDMLQNGFAEVVSTDISECVVQRMATAHAAEGRLKWVVSDCTHMGEFGDSEFDFVIDKGTLDALYCGARARESVAAALGEVRRVLKTGAHFIDVSFGSEAQRKEITQCCVDGMRYVQTIKLANPNSDEKHNYVYILEKVH